MRRLLPLLLLTGCAHAPAPSMPPPPSLASVTFTWPDWNAWYILTCEGHGRWEVGVAHSHTVTLPPGPAFCVLEQEQPVADGSTVIVPGYLAMWAGTIQPGSQTVAVMLETR